MNFEINTIFNLSVGFSVLIGWIRYHKTGRHFLPFLIFVSLGLTNEITDILSERASHLYIISVNISHGVKALLLTWQFKGWGLFRRHKKLYYAVQVFFAASWIAENLVSLRASDSYFIISNSFVIFLMGILCLNRFAINETTSLYRLPVSLICLGLMVFFTCVIDLETVASMHLPDERFFRLRIPEIMAYVMLVTNIIFVFAFLCIPIKPKYIMRKL